MHAREPAPKSYGAQLADAVESIQILFPAAHYVFWGFVSFATFVRDNFIQKIEDRFIDPEAQKKRGVVANAFFTSLKYAATIAVVYLLMLKWGFAIATLAAVVEYGKELRDGWDKGPWEALKQAWADIRKPGNKIKAYRNLIQALRTLIVESIKSLASFLKVVPIGMIACGPIVPVSGPIIALTGLAIVALTTLFKSAAYIKNTTSRSAKENTSANASEERPLTETYDKINQHLLSNGRALTNRDMAAVLVAHVTAEQALEVARALAPTSPEDASQPALSALSAVFGAFRSTLEKPTTSSPTKQDVQHQTTQKRDAS